MPTCARRLINLYRKGSIKVRLEEKDADSAMETELTANMPSISEARMTCMNLNQTHNNAIQSYSPQQQRGTIQEEPTIIRTNIIYDPPQRNATQYIEVISRFPNTDHTILAQQEREAIQQLKSKLVQAKPKRTTAL